MDSPNSELEEKKSNFSQSDLSSVITGENKYKSLQSETSVQSISFSSVSDIDIKELEDLDEDEILEKLDLTPIDKDEIPMKELDKLIEESEKLLKKGEIQIEKSKKMFEINDISEDYKEKDGVLGLPPSFVNDWKLNFGRDPAKNMPKMTPDQEEKMSRFRIESEEDLKKFQKWVDDNLTPLEDLNIDKYLYFQSVSMNYNGSILYFHHPNSKKLQIFKSRQKEEFKEKLAEDPSKAGKLKLPKSEHIDFPKCFPLITSRKEEIEAKNIPVLLRGGQRRNATFFQQRDDCLRFSGEHKIDGRRLHLGKQYGRLFRRQVSEFRDCRREGDSE